MKIIHICLLIVAALVGVTEQSRSIGRRVVLGTADILASVDLTEMYISDVVSVPGDKFLYINESNKTFKNALVVILIMVQL